MRRLFFTFADGPPGIGLLLLRVLAGTAVAIHNIMILRGEPPLGLALFAVLLIALALLLIAGLWTPVAAALIAGSSLCCVFGCYAFGQPVDVRYFIIVGVQGLALFLLGPGAWSVDARLFGWKRL